LIEVKNIGKRFRKFWVLKNVSFKLQKGEVLGIVGKNGCGKSTLLKLVAGILKPSAGEIKLNSKLVSYIPEKPILIPEISLEDNIRYFANLRNITKKRILDEINYFGLENHLRKKPKELSKGLQQRLSMAIALLPDPEIVLMDEPTSGLDMESKKLIIERIDKLKEGNKVILYVTHEDEEIEKNCSKVLILEDGQTLFFGTVEDFWKKYERFVYIIIEGKSSPMLVKIEDLKKYDNVIHVRSVGIRELLSGGVDFETNGGKSYTKTN